MNATNDHMFVGVDPHRLCVILSLEKRYTNHFGKIMGTKPLNRALQCNPESCLIDSGTTSSSLVFLVCSIALVFTVSYFIFFFF